MSKLVYCDGVEGNSIYLNDYRILGPKPWGGGTTIEEWDVDDKVVADHLPVETLRKSLAERSEGTLSELAGHTKELSVKLHDAQEETGALREKLHAATVRLGLAEKLYQACVNIPLGPGPELDDLNNAMRTWENAKS